MRLATVTSEERAAEGGEHAGTMGPFDVVTAALDSATGLGGLAVALCAWLRPRSGTSQERRVLVRRVVRREGDGPDGSDATTVELTGASVEEVERLLRALADGRAPDTDARGVDGGPTGGEGRGPE